MSLSAGRGAIPLEIWSRRRKAKSKSSDTQLKYNVRYALIADAKLRSTPELIGKKKLFAFSVDERRPRVTIRYSRVVAPSIVTITSSHNVSVIMRYFKRDVKNVSANYDRTNACNTYNDIRVIYNVYGYMCAYVRMYVRTL